MRGRFLEAFSLLLAIARVANASPTIEKRDNEGAPNGFEREGIVYEYVQCSEVISPKVFIISMFAPEADIWYSNSETPGSIGNLLAQNISVPGFSPLFPSAHCLADSSVCQLTTGESEINAAVTISSLLQSPSFNLTKTYFLIAGIAGINPKHGTLGAVAFSKYAVQVALQYEFDAREIPENFSTGYVPQGAYAPDQYPSSIYGTEVFEVNEALRDLAVSFAQKAELNDSSAAVAYRAHYAIPSPTPEFAADEYAAATREPGIITCDVATSDVYYSGKLLGEAFENTTSLFTNGSGVYCMTAQEDNATLEALLRGALSSLVDFSRVIIMRTASDFDRPYPGESVLDNLFYAEQGGFEPAINNIYLAGNEVVKGLLAGWAGEAGEGEWAGFENGLKSGNYMGDIFGSLGGTPDFGPGVQNEPLERRGGSRRAAYGRMRKGREGWLRAVGAGL